MSLKGTFYCDWRECECQGGAWDGHMYPPPGFLTVKVSEPGDRMFLDHHFCTWDCLLKHAAAQEPIEVL